MVFDDVKVGDKFRDKKRHITLTVTELTEGGFKYDCTPHHVLPARYGFSEVKSGELFYNFHKYIDWDMFYENVKETYSYEI